MIRFIIKKVAKEKKGWSLYKLANELKVSKVTVYSWNRCSHLPSLKTLDEICELLDCTVGELFERV